MIKKITLFTFLLSLSLLGYSDNLEKLKAPQNFVIDIISAGLDSPRQLAETNNGHILVGSKKGSEVVALIDRYKSGTYEKLVVADGLENPAGVAVYDGDLYFAEMDTVWIINDIDSWINLDSKTLHKKKIYMNNITWETWHGIKYIDYGTDGRLEMRVGVQWSIGMEPRTKGAREGGRNK